MKINTKQELAKAGENVAARYLLSKGYKVLSRNFRTRQGEIDLIVEKDQHLIFIEVKSRRSYSIDSAVASVSYRKQVHITKVAQIYCKRNPQFDQYNTRFDVIVLLYSTRTDDFKVHHLIDAFLPVLDV